MQNETRVGIFVAIGIFLLGLAIFMLGDLSLRSEYPIYVQFADVAGLPRKSTVKLSGVEIGKVTDVYIEGGKVMVAIRVRHGVEIYKNAVFKIGATSLIGSKYLQISQGTPDSGVIEAGAHVQGYNEEAIEKVITRTLSSAQKLIDDVNQNGKLGRELNATVTNVRELTARLNDLVANLQPSMNSAMHNVDNMTAKLDNLIAKADEIVTKINTGQGTVGALVSDPKMKEDLTQTVENIKQVSHDAKKIVGNINNFKVEWLYSSQYEPQARTSRGDIGIKISPRPGHYYKLGLSNLGNSDDQPKGPDYAERNKLDAQLGWESKRYDFYAGIIKGSGGVGLKFTPLPDRPVLGRFALTGQAYDFLRNRVVKGRLFDKPQFDLGGEIRLHRIVSVGARVVDIQGTGDSQYYANIKFEDKDIAYLLGLVTLGTMKTSGN